MSAAAARQPLGALGVRSAAVLWAAIVDWLSEWRDASHHDDERPRIAVSLLMAALACAGFDDHGASSAPEICVAVAMLLLQHVLLGLGAALLGPLI